MTYDLGKQNLECDRVTSRVRQVEDLAAIIPGCTVESGLRPVPGEVIEKPSE